MLDASQNLREIISGFNSMAAQVGLLPNFGGQSFGGPMALGFQQPQTKHPGQVAQEMADQLKMQVQAATQQAQTQNQFAKDFSDRLQAIQQTYLPPQIAQYMAQMRGAPMMGMPGPGGIPSPIYQTPAVMGMYRPPLPPNFMYAPGGTMQPGVPPVGFNAPMPAPFIPQPYMSLFPGGPQLGSMLPQWFGGPAPIGRFGEPWQRQQVQQETMGNRAFAQAMAVTPTLFGTVPGAIGGAALGGRFGGWRGALAGFMVGGIAGGFAAEPLGLTRIGEQFTEPLVRTRAFGNQLEAMTQQFVVTGSELHPLGRGLSQQASIRTAERMQRMVEGGEMSEFNMRDLMRITNIAGQRGMLDMAQSGEQISGQVRNVARALRQFMMIAEMPDVQQAMHTLASMRQMGLSIPESMVAARNAQIFARMAGTTTQALLATGGAQGGFLFQQQGLTSGLGLQAGVGAFGIARQAVAAGTYTPQQLALAGNLPGLAQTTMEGQAAMLNLRYPLLAMLSRNAQGELIVDPNRMGDVMSGKVSMAQQAAMATTNIVRLAQQGGVSQERVIAEFTARQRELADEAGRRMGPMGMQMMLIRQGMNINKEFGGQLGLAGGLMQLGLSPQQARSLAQMAENPEFWRGIQQQYLVDVPRQRQEEAARREAVMSAGGWRMGMQEFGQRVEQGESWTNYLPPVAIGRGLYLGGRAAATGLRNKREEIASWWAGTETTDQGAAIMKTPSWLEVSDRETQRALARIIGSPGWEEQKRRRAGLDLSGIGRRQPLGELSERELSRVSYEAAREGLQFVPSLPVALGASLAPKSTAAEQTDVVRGLQAGGGVKGWLAGALPGLTSAFYSPEFRTSMESQEALMVTPAEREQLAARRKVLLGKAADVARIREDVAAFGRAAAEGARMSEETRRTTRRTLQASLSSILKRTVDEKEEAGYENVIVQEIVQRLGSPDFITKGVSQHDLKQMAIDALRKKGMPADAAEQYVRENWDAIQPMIASRAESEGGKAVKAKIAHAKTYAGISDLDTARSYKEFIDRARKEEDETREMMGAGMFTDRISKESYQRFQELGIRAEADEGPMGQERMLVRVAKTLQARGGEEAAKQARGILEGVGGRIGEDKLRELERAEAGGIAGPAGEAAMVFGKTLSKLSGPEQQKLMREVLGRGKDVREEDLLRRGAAAMADRPGAKESATALRERAKSDSTLRQRLIAAGQLTGSRQELGGPGVWGDAEAQTKSLVDRIGDFAAEVVPQSGAIKRLVTGKGELTAAGGFSSDDLKKFHDGANMLYQAMVARNIALARTDG